MAVSRYNQRKDYEEEEANAIGTEYVRVDFLPASDAANLWNLLERYLEQPHVVLHHPGSPAARAN